MSLLLSWGDIFTEQLSGDKIIEHRQKVSKTLDTWGGRTYYKQKLARWILEKLNYYGLTLGCGVYSMAPRPKKDEGNA